MNDISELSAFLVCLDGFLWQCTWLCFAFGDAGVMDICGASLGELAHPSLVVRLLLITAFWW